MSELNRDDLSQMILKLAHGIRNPLATIKTGVQLVKHLSEPNKEVEEYLDSALESVKRIDSIIVDLQRYVALGPTMPVHVPFESLIQEAMDDRVEKCDIKLELSAKGTICVDHNYMVYCIRELLNNAIENTPPGYEIKIILERSDDSFLHMHIDDSCGGIHPDLSERILRPFFSTSPSGTGLGLSIVSKFLDISGGALSIKPKHGKGCRFTISLPEV